MYISSPSLSNLYFFSFLSHPTSDLLVINPPSYLSSPGAKLYVHETKDKKKNNVLHNIRLVLLPHLQRQHLCPPNPRLCLRPPQQRQCHRHHVQMLLPRQRDPLLRRLRHLLSRPRAEPGRFAGLSDGQWRAERRCVLQRSVECDCYGGCYG